MTPPITAVVPVYNEIALLERSTERIADFVENHLPGGEILLVESGSSDGSREVADALADRVPGVRVVHEQERRGFGSAIRLGIREARGDLVWIVPADTPFPLETILVALPHFDRADAVLSYRSEDRRGAFRAVRSAVYNGVARALLGLSVRSVNSAFKVYRRAAVSACSLTSNGWFIDAEILYCLQGRRAKLVEIPVPLIDRTAGRSSVTALDPLRVLLELLRFRLSRR